MAGEEIRLGSLAPVRDLTFVEDTAEAFLAVAECDSAIGAVVNSGNGKGITIGELVRRILRLMNLEGHCSVVSDADRVRPEKSEVFELICDNRLLHQLTGWRPQVTLDDGLTQTIDYISRHLGRFKPAIYNV